MHWNLFEIVLEANSIVEKDGRRERSPGKETAVYSHHWQLDLMGLSLETEAVVNVKIGHYFLHLFVNMEKTSTDFNWCIALQSHLNGGTAKNFLALFSTF